MRQKEPRRKSPSHIFYFHFNLICLIRSCKNDNFLLYTPKFLRPLLLRFCGRNTPQPKKQKQMYTLLLPFDTNSPVHLYYYCSLTKEDRNRVLLADNHHLSLSFALNSESIVSFLGAVPKP